MRGASQSDRNRIAGAALLVVALGWIVVVEDTIAPSAGTTAGPRAFPLFFGLALAALSVVLLFQGFRPTAEEERTPEAPLLPNEHVAVIATIGSMVAYAALLEPIGFIPSTALVVAGLMICVLRIRNPVLIAAMSLGLSLGCFLVFNKLLGTYLPPGTWLSINF